MFNQKKKKTTRRKFICFSFLEREGDPDVLEL